MMKLLKPYYIISILVGGWILWYSATGNTQAEEFYGFAENRDTEINFNYPVVVKEIHISEGENINQGDLLFQLQRIQPKEEYAGESYRISELRAESNIWKTEKEGSLRELIAEYDIDRQSILDKITSKSEELKYKKSLYEGVKSLNEVNLDYSSLENELLQLNQQKNLLDSLFIQQKSNLENELRFGTSPFREEIKRLEARMKFEEEQMVQDIEIHAPFNGLVGNIQCKEEEHIPSFKTLMNFYEPNPSMVKGFIHEDLILKVRIGDVLTIRSTSDPNLIIKGSVSGLGSRVVEIPSRLRKIPDLKTYGREVLISIPEENNLIQKEKVVIEVS